MKNLMLALLVSGFGLTAFAAPQYECHDLSGDADYEITIDSNNKTAKFAEMRYSFNLKLTKMHATKLKHILEFTGPENGYDGQLRIVFNVNKKTAAVYSTNAAGSVNYMGRAFCEEIYPWD